MHIEMRRNIKVKSLANTETLFLMGVPTHSWSTHYLENTLTGGNNVFFHPDFTDHKNH